MRHSRRLTTTRLLLASALLPVLALCLAGSPLHAQDPPAGKSVTAEAAMADFTDAVWAEVKLETREARDLYAHLYQRLQACPEVLTPEGRTQRVLAEACLARFSMLSFDIGNFQMRAKMMDDSAAQILKDKHRLTAAWFDIARGDIKGGRTREESFHWLTRWTFIGPFRNESGVGFDTEYAPESSEPPGLAEQVAGAAREVGWRQMTTEPFFGEIVLDDFMAPDAKVLAYAVTLLDNTTGDPLDVALRFGTTGSWKVWLNGKQLGSKDVRRNAQWMDQEAVGLPLQPGLNRLMMKLCVEEHEWKYNARLT
ncbi:MAG: hypothetical protein AB7S36_23795, partial [Planctomycetota bacterium]